MACGVMLRLKASPSQARLPFEEAFAASLLPPLKWAGGKRWLVPTLKDVLRGRPFQRLVEPFVGGMAVTLALAPRRALLSDANPHLINFYQWLQRGLNIERARVPLENDSTVYYANRSRFNSLVNGGGHSSEEAAALFYYLNRTAFNGLCRFNRRGEFNVPFGKYRSISYRRDFAGYNEALAPYIFRSGDFSDVSVRDGDFVYADPPYDVEFTSYSSDGFGWPDQVRLAEWLARQEAPVIASNQATVRVIELYGDLGFAVKTLTAPRRISCDGNRDDALEILAIKGL